MANTMTEFEKALLPKMIKLMQELPVEMKAYIVGYTQSEVDRLHKEVAHE